MPPGEPAAAGRIAVCSLSSRELLEPLSGLPDVAIVGTLMTANLGIEQLVRTIAHRPSIRGLVVCGRDSPRFLAGQSLVALFREGVDAEQRLIRGAAGYLPVLRGVALREVAQVRAQIELVDARGECDPAVLRRVIADLSARTASAPAPAVPDADDDTAGPGEGADGGPASTRPAFRRLRPGGRRVGISRALDGFVVIGLDLLARRIVLRHYDNDLTPRHEMTGVRAESMLLGLLSAGVVAEPAHAGYLGGELAKAETALRLGLPYVQDLPLRAPGRPAGARRPGPDREDTPTMGEATSSPYSLAEFLSALVAGLGVEGVELDPEVPLGIQLLVDSARMIELAILLEEELGLDLPADVDLRRASPLELYGALTG
ncbi:hypothetical protein ACFWOG_16470 [Kitasatospora sp. NPDC058406]|uniref:DUF4346 domain-containing protein n=1 Tax=Streptomycetaceae TaxID=2062 RepID=UPI002E796654|nr:hypothetical protein [Streptomyces sp. BE303]MED7953434.1 hypothetical protein [Streptomyces sp. BE303]